MTQRQVNKSRHELELLVNTYFPVLSKFAFDILRDSEAAKDIVQDVFLRYWQGDEKFLTANELKAWLYQTTRNRSLNELRSRQRYEAHNVSALAQVNLSDNSILTSIVKAETLATVYAFVKELPEQMRNVFEMYYVEGLPIGEIAIKLGITPKTVSNHRYNAMSVLRAKLGNDTDALMCLWLMIRIAD